MSIFLKIKDIERLEGLNNYRYAQKKMKQYFDKLQKKPGQKLTIFEYARINGVPSDDIIKALKCA